MTPYTPSDAEIEAALAAWYGNVNWRWTFYRNGPDHSFAIDGMRAALIAAATARTNEQRERVGT